MAAPAAPTITLTPITCGRLTRPSARRRMGDPVTLVTAYLVEHPVGKVLFDTGLGPRFARPVGEQGSGPVDLEEDALIDARLRAIGVQPEQIGYILNSHLHADHAGGNALLPSASVIVQAAEWQHATTSLECAYHAPEFDTGQPIIRIDGEHDVFGDGAVILFPTPGHTPGHQSARVQTAAGQVLLAAETCDFCTLLTQPVPWDPIR
jgi:N-acyl homoserine lactone hydrolase